MKAAWWLPSIQRQFAVGSVYQADLQMCPRDPDFEAKATLILGLCRGTWETIKLLGTSDYMLNCDEESYIRASWAQNHDFYCKVLRLTIAVCGGQSSLWHIIPGIIVLFYNYINYIVFQG